MLRVPGRGFSNIPVYDPKIPKLDELAILPPDCLECTRVVGKALSGKNSMNSMWGIGGDAGLVMHGVAVKPDHLEIVTTRDGAIEMLTRLTLSSKESPSLPSLTEKKLTREAIIDGKNYAVIVRSYYSELMVGGVRVEIYGDKQFKIGEWEWGDPLEFKPEVTQVVDTDVFLVPLRLESELSFGLGWTDLSNKIAEAISRQTHRHMKIHQMMDE